MYVRSLSPLVHARPPTRSLRLPARMHTEDGAPSAVAERRSVTEAGQMLRLLFWTLLTARASTAPSGTIPSTTQEAAPLTGSSLATMVAPGAVQSSFTDGSDRPDISFDSEYDALSVFATSLGDSDIIGVRRQLFTDSPVANGFIFAGIGLAGCICCTGCYCWAQAGRARMLSVEGGATTQGGAGSVLGGFWHWGA